MQVAAERHGAPEGRRSDLEIWDIFDGTREKGPGYLRVTQTQPAFVQYSKIGIRNHRDGKRAVKDFLQRMKREQPKQGRQEPHRFQAPVAFFLAFHLGRNLPQGCFKRIVLFHM